MGNKTDFSDLNEQDAVGVVVNTAILASMHNESITVHKNGERIAVLINGWTLNEAGVVVKPQPAKIEAKAIVENGQEVTK